MLPLCCETFFLSSIDRELESTLDKGTVLRICRYVDDFLVILATDFNVAYDDTVQSVLCCFTHELPVNNRLQFLDKYNVLWRTLVLDICQEQRELLPYGLTHSKTVKRAICSLCLESALTKSCEYMLETSFIAQIDRLKNAGFPRCVLSAVSESLL